MKITLDVTLIEFMTCTQWHGTMAEEMSANRERSCEDIRRAEDKTKRNKTS